MSAIMSVRSIDECIDDYSPPQSPTQTLTSTDVSINWMNRLSIRSVFAEKMTENSIIISNSKCFSIIALIMIFIIIDDIFLLLFFHFFYSNFSRIFNIYKYIINYNNI